MRPPAPSTGRRGRPPDRPDRRASILAAALDCFVERGFHGTAIPQIAERAGIAAGTLYHYFDSKEALVNALYRTWKAAVAQRVFTAFPQGAPVREQFRVMWDEMVAFAREAPAAFAFIELHNHASYLDADSRALEERITTFGIEFIRGAQRRGELRAAPPLLLVGIVMGAFIGLVRKSAECDLVLDDAAWATAEQCVWEAIRV